MGYRNKNESVTLDDLKQFETQVRKYFYERYIEENGVDPSSVDRVVDECNASMEAIGMPVDKEWGSEDLTPAKLVPCIAHGYQALCHQHPRFTNLKHLSAPQVEAYNEVTDATIEYVFTRVDPNANTCPFAELEGLVDQGRQQHEDLQEQASLTGAKQELSRPKNKPQMQRTKTVTKISKPEVKPARPEYVVDGNLITGVFRKEL